MEHFTTPTMKGEEDKKNDPTFLNTLVIVTFSYTEYSVCLGREYRVGVEQAGLGGSGDDDTQILTH